MNPLLASVKISPGLFFPPSWTIKFLLCSGSARKSSLRPKIKLPSDVSPFPTITPVHARIYVENSSIKINIVNKNIVFLNFMSSSPIKIIEYHL